MGWASSEDHAPGSLPSSTLLLSVDFEDWHQLVRRRYGVAAWEAPGPALARQTEAMLALFGELGVRATFFVLGMAARGHPELVRGIADAGHEIGCHGDRHLPVHGQTPDAFRADLHRARATVEELSGQTPRGFRAPMFSITNRSRWAYEVLAEEGFAYDASQHESPAIRDHVVPAEAGPHPLPGTGLWEFPVAVWRRSSLRLPVGGASYWSVLPRAVVLRGLTAAGAGAGLYLHPHELDPRPLDPLLGPGVPAAGRAKAWLRAGQRNAARRRAGITLRAIAEAFTLIPYGDAHARLAQRIPARP